MVGAVPIYPVATEMVVKGWRLASGLPVRLDFVLQLTPQAPIAYKDF